MRKKRGKLYTKYEHRSPWLWAAAYMNGLTIREVANTFNTTPTQVKYRLIYERVPIRTGQSVVAGYATTPTTKVHPVGVVSKGDSNDK